MGQITLNLPEKVAVELAEASRSANRAPDDFALELLERGLAIRGFKAAREAILRSLGDNAPKTDEDAFKILP